MTNEAIFFSSRSQTHSWLSNMTIDPYIDKDGTTWTSVEHEYQAAKARCKHDADRIRQARSPFDAKRLGGQVDARADWRNYRLTAMRRALANRFASGRDAARQLAATGDRMLLHETPWGRYGDPFWGTGRDGNGQNILGRMLMERRTELAEPANLTQAEGAEPRQSQETRA